MIGELRDHVEAFVCGRISLIELDEWLTSRLRNVMIDSIEYEIVAHVLMALHNLQHEIESEDDIRRQFSLYLIEGGTTSSNRTLRMRWRMT